MKYIIIFAALCLSSCASVPPNTKSPARFALGFKGDFSLKEKAKLFGAFNEHKKAWETNFKLPTRNANVIVVRERFEREPGKLLIGVCYSKKQLIKVYMGESCEMPALYHEMCHLNIDHGNKHDNAKFPWKRWRDEAWTVRNRLCRNTQR